MRYDVATKVVVEHGKEAILRELVGIEAVEAELIEELPQETVSLRRSDYPLRVRDREGEERIVLLEFQTAWRWEVPLRLLEYQIRYKLRYRLPVMSVVLLFRRREDVTEEYEDESVRFRYKVIRLWQMDGDEVLRRKEIWIYPFIPVMRGGDENVFVAEEEIYGSDMERGVKADLLTALTIFSGFRGEEIVRRLLERRRDIMIESPAYEIIREEGLREGIQRGLQQGMLEDAREMVLEALSVKFGVLPIDLIEEIKGIQLREVLKQLLRAAMTVESLDQFREQLGRVKG